MWDVLVSPFTEFQFMRAALVSVVFLALSAAPVGVFLVIRRMSLMGDALSHAVLPGAAPSDQEAADLIALPFLGQKTVLQHQRLL